MIASAWMKTSANVTYRLRINYYIAGVLQGNLNIDANSNGTDWQRVSLPFTSVPSTIDKIRIYQWMHTRTSGTTVWMELDDLQLEEATIPSAWHPYPGDYEVKVWVQSADPGAAAKENDEWVNTSDNRIYVRKSGAWVRKETVGDGDIDTNHIVTGAATEVFTTEMNTDTYIFPGVGVRDRTFAAVNVTNASGAALDIEVSVTGGRAFTTPSGLVGAADLFSWVSISNVTDGLSVASTQDYMPIQIEAQGPSDQGFYLESTVCVISIPNGKQYSFTPFARALIDAGSTGNVVLKTDAYTMRITVIKR